MTTVGGPLSAGQFRSVSVALERRAHASAGSLMALAREGHIDVRVADPGPWDVAERARLIRQKVPKLVTAAATVIPEERYGDALGDVVMRDHEGNGFRVA
ncbi:hypothetical protein DER29_2834 [Micromonospora sp. M71_S20]|nr:hypothetical protein DER29_2834 [Micromonospora sp. M71_S20]